MAWRDPLDSKYAGNPFYEVERDRRGGMATATRILAYGCLGLIYLALAAIAIDRFHPAQDLGWPAAMIVNLLVHLVCVFWSPATTAVWLAGERERETLTQLLVAPYPRDRMVAGVLAARMRPMIHMLALGFPAYLVGGSLLGASSGSGWRAGSDLLENALPLLFSLLLWGSTALVAWFGAAVGIWASANARTVGGAIGLSFAMLVGILIAAGSVCGCVPLVMVIVLPRPLLNAAVKRLDAEDIL